MRRISVQPIADAGFYEVVKAENRDECCSRDTPFTYRQLYVAEPAREEYESTLNLI